MRHEDILMEEERIALRNTYLKGGAISLLEFDISIFIVSLMLFCYTQFVNGYLFTHMLSGMCLNIIILSFYFSGYAHLKAYDDFDIYSNPPPHNWYKEIVFVLNALVLALFIIGIISMF